MCIRDRYRNGSSYFGGMEAVVEVGLNRRAYRNGFFWGGDEMDKREGNGGEEILVLCHERDEGCSTFNYRERKEDGWSIVARAAVKGRRGLIEQGLEGVCVFVEVG